MRLEIKDLRVHYGKIEAIKGVSVVVNQGEIVTLIGANGAGKTTILKTISGLRPVSSGEITFDGENINKIPAHVARRSRYLTSSRRPRNLSWYDSS
jgi:branched-chain amino acid transport system ATP-binding protein